MKTKLLLIISLIFAYGNSQTTTTYDQRVAHYSNFSDGGGTFDQSTDEVGMWANSGNKQVASWRSFTDTGLPGGSAGNMEVGDNFRITVNATQAYGQIGVALLASPSATASWNDRHNNYAVQVNLNGNSGAYDPWEVVSTGGTINASTINGSSTAADFNILFTLTAATTMTVDIQKNAETAQSFSITLNNTDISGYSIYLADDWNGTTNSNIYWKPTTEYVEPAALSTASINTQKELNVFYSNGKIHVNNSNNEECNIGIYNLFGQLIKNIDGAADVNPVTLKTGVYVVKAKLLETNTTSIKKIIIE
jgi:hypothetical protein